MKLTTWVFWAVAVIALGVVAGALAQTPEVAGVRKQSRTLEQVVFPQQADRLVLLRPAGERVGYPVGTVFVDLQLLCVPRDTAR